MIRQVVIGWLLAASGNALAQDELSPDAVACLENKMVLSSDDKATASKQYFFAVDAFRPDGGRLRKRFEILVMRQDDQRAILVRYADGLPYAYYTNGLVVMLDAKDQCLRLLEEGLPQFVLRYEREDGVVLAIAQAKRSVDFVFDATSIGKRDDRIISSFDSLRRTLIVNSSKGQARFEFALDKSAPVGLAQLVLEDRAGACLVVHRFAVGSDCPVDLTKITVAAMRKTGLEMKAMSEVDRKAPPFPPEPILADEAERRTAANWNEVFKTWARPNGK